MTSIYSGIIGNRGHEPLQEKKETIIGEETKPQTLAITPISETIFESFKKAATFPLLRYFGAKSFSLPGVAMRLPGVAFDHLFNESGTLSSFKAELLDDRGYHHFDVEPLPKEKAEQYMVYASCNAAVTQSIPKWMRPYRYFPVVFEGEIKERIMSLGLSVHDSVIFHPKNGLKVIVFKNEDQLLIAFGPRGSHYTEFEEEKKKESDAIGSKMTKDAVLEVAGAVPSLYRKANQLMALLRDHFKRKTITLTGQCLGGTIASYVALKQELKYVCLNSLPLGPGLQCDIGKEKLQKADQYGTHLMIEGDLVSDFPLPLKVVDYALGLLGFKTAGNFGKKYRIPSIYDNTFDTHVYVIGSLFAHWKPKQLKFCQQLPQNLRAFEKALYSVQLKKYNFLRVLS